MNVAVFQNEDGSHGVAAFPNGKPEVVEGAVSFFVISRDQLPDTPPSWWDVDFDAETVSQGVKPPTSTNPRDYVLTPTAWRHMVRKAGLWEHIDTVKAHLKVNDLSAWADLMETLEGNQFDFEATLDQITLFAPMLAGMPPLPDEAALTPLWLDAAARTEQ